MTTQYHKPGAVCLIYIVKKASPNVDTCVVIHGACSAYPRPHSYMEAQKRSRSTSLIPLFLQAKTGALGPLFVRPLKERRIYQMQPPPPPLDLNISSCYCSVNSVHIVQLHPTAL